MAMPKVGRIGTKSVATLVKALRKNPTLKKEALGGR
jgi:hypothetical protein